ncbi:dynamin family protein [Schaalia vaccimaxillae]|uniref:dynamin family protein n=1 Tax=Schaalia vaccimaxillae TaxID=183916 RepID=UPI0003F7E78B|nr:GTPase domain-containing protein [Schaalia vaccimaxillae]
MTQIERVEHLRSVLTQVRPLLDVSSRQEGEAARDRALRRIDDHVIPRLESLDAPLVAVVGGSTGAGKSTLVNTLVGRVVSTASAVRPTTRRPLLVASEQDLHWFETSRILPSLARVRLGDTTRDESASSTTSLGMTTSEALPESIALIDAPDVDSIAVDNRELARHLLDAADLWIFVTTAARYADAIPWQILDEAATRGIDIAVVLNRVPEGARQAVESDLRRMLNERQLGRAPIFTIDEQPLEGSLLPQHSVAPLVEWLQSLGASAQNRAQIARRALSGSLASVRSECQVVTQTIDDHNEAVERAHNILAEEISTSGQRIATSIGDGTVLRGEVLARWQEVVGTWDISRKIDQTVSLLRDRLTAMIKGRPAPVAPVEDALEDGLAAILREEFLRVRERSEDRFLQDRALAPIVVHADTASELEADSLARDVTISWQRQLLELIRHQGGSKKTTARVMAIGVNIVSVALMIVIFSTTGGLTGAEVGVAGASAALAQRLLESVFGDQAVRAMAARAQDMLLESSQTVLSQRVEPLRQMLPGTIDAQTLQEATEGVRGREE